MNLDIPGGSERRQTPRFEIELPFDMVLENGTILPVNTRNISSCGLQVSCDSWITDEIEPRGIQNHAISHIRLKAIIELPISHINSDYASSNIPNTAVKKLYSNCRIMSVQRLSQDEFMLNLAFIDFENGSEKVLNDFIDQFDQKKTLINVSA